MRHCATSRKVAGSIPDDIILPAPHYGPVVEPVSNRNENLGGGGIMRPVGRADNLTTFMYRLSVNLEASTSWKA